LIKELVISNYALIQSLKVNFNTGMTSITGETGAGKSILIGGLSLLLGKRADLNNLKDSSKKCFIEGIFSIEKYNLKSFFESLEIDYDPVTIIRREIIPSGKSRAFVNDSPVTLDVLIRIGQNLIDVHSQNETLFLKTSDYQLEVLDALAENIKAREVFTLRLAEYNKVKLELNYFKVEYEKLNNEMDYINYLKKELDHSNFENISFSDIEDELNTLENIEEIKFHLMKCLQILDHEKIGVKINLAEMISSFKKLNNLTNEFNELKSRIEILKIESEDISLEIESFAERLIMNPERVEYLNHKINMITDLYKKHNVSSVDELIEVKNSLDKKVKISNDLSEKINNLSRIEKKLNLELNQLSIKLNKSRLETIPKLKIEIEGILSDLGMNNAKFNIELKKSKEFLSFGTDFIIFEFSGNNGTDFKILKKVASGGELSRIMLSIKAILSRFKSLPTIIFDEIDTGVSGEISTKMADLMIKMSKHMQVFVISHSPQVAAKGDYHIKVFKESDNFNTETKLKLLSKQERISEIAYMLGGGDNSSTAIEHAKQLLN